MILPEQAMDNEEEQQLIAIFHKSDFG